MEVFYKMLGLKGILELIYVSKDKISVLTGQSSFKPSTFNRILKWRKGSSIEGIPYLPGSSIKGMLRINAQRIAWLLGLTSCGQKLPEKIKEKHTEGICNICKLFGCPDNTSKVQISDALPFIEDVPTTVFTGIRLNLKSHTTDQGALFQYEAFCKDISLKGTIHFQNLDDREIKLILLALKELNWSGIGHQSGLISVKIINTEEMAENIKNLIKGVFNIV